MAAEAQALQPANRQRAPSIENEADLENQVINVQDESKDQYQRGVRVLMAQANAIISTLLILVLGGSGYIVAELIISDEAALSPSIRTVVYSLTLIATGTLAYYGLFFTHRYGGTTQQIRILEKAKDLLVAGNAEFEEQATDLKTKVKELTDFTNINIRQTQDKLESIVEDGEEIGRIAASIKSNNEETAEMFKIIKEIQRLTKKLRRDIGRNELMKIFYELENSDDDKDGLNKAEYDRFMDRLDKETADAFREVTSFRRMDRNGNGNGVIEVKEFERALNDVYEYLDELDQRDVAEFERQEFELQQANR
eukprot:CAMPEP_0201581622 /NCGR_PEP_ID=MMETSP0190_2-20130828/72330_1 /ASSEMBLY_ACC=CAM_ASM_000263 /TAXON_ID=37353 /ORGANISM="Rosalina sp." /LENGTH=309 /DNA_ID=CAMNT_0048019977 /DNA_START=29 /DNA_END=961 /DNA_ORIENTATION=+